jgi:hypothetical protein
MSGLALGTSLARRRRRAAGVRRLLDGLAIKPDAAHSSSRLLSSLWNGPLFRALRLADGVEQDFGADQFGNLDQEAVLNFAGRGSNYLRYSEDYGNLTAWANSCTVSGKTLTSIGISSGINQNLTAPLGGPAYFSVDVLTAGTTSPWIRLAWSDGGTAYQTWANLSTGAVGTVNAGVTLTSLAITGGWRFALTRTPVSATTIVYIRLEEANNSASGSTGRTLVVDRTQFYSVLGAAYIRTYAVSSPGVATIRTWYDLMGNGKHAEQTNAAQQFRLVNGGVLDLQNGRPLLFGGVNTQTSMVSPVPMREPSTQVCVTSRVTGAVRWGNSESRGNGGAPEDQFTVAFGNFVYDGGVRTSPGTAGLPSTLALQVGVTRLNNNNSYNRWDNGVARGATAKGGIVTAGNFVIGNTANRVQSLNGFAAEYMFFQGILSDADRQLIEADQKAYYGTP